MHSGKLDPNGRCCGRKPLHYKGGSYRSPDHPMKFCSRCDREYCPDTGIQRENWAWVKDEEGVWTRRNRAVTLPEPPKED